jgi:hypothetical protein
MTDHAPRFKEAEYKDPGLAEYAENPLIAALPHIMSPKDVVKELSKVPKISSAEVNLPGSVRVHAISRLTRDFFVPQTTHLVLEQKISQLIRRSYLSRNPKKAEFKRKLNSVRDAINQFDLTTYVSDIGNSPASSMAMAGISGVGKSTATNRILNTYDRVIFHPDYHLLQIPWIKVECPYGGSLSEFCESFFIALDKRLNTNYRKKYTSGRPSIGRMIADVADLCLIHAIGLLVVDEFQHMDLAKSGGERKMINFLVTLVNVVEVSVMIIGTPKMLPMFASEFRQARRASGEGSIVWDRMSLDESWEEFLGQLWPFQWLKSPIVRDEALTNALYELSQGIPDIVVKLFCLAQARAILLARTDEDERLSVALFEDVYEDELSVVAPLLEALKTNDKKALRHCHDLEIPKIESALMGTFDQIKSEALNQKRRVEIGEPEQTDVANSALDTVLKLGVEQDVAKPMIEDLFNTYPDITLIEIIQKITTTLSGLDVTPKKKKAVAKKPTIKAKDWGKLEANDLRKTYFDKTGTMYEALVERQVIYPMDTLMVS